MMNTAVDFQALIAWRDMDERVKERVKASGDILLHTMQSEHRRLDGAIQVLDGKIAALDDKIAALDKKIDATALALDKKIDATALALDKKIDATALALDKKIDATALALGDRITALAAENGARFNSLDARMDKMHAEILSMKKWTIGLFATAMLAIAGGAAAAVVSLLA